MESSPFLVRGKLETHKADSKIQPNIIRFICNNIINEDDYIVN